MWAHQPQPPPQRPNPGPHPHPPAAARAEKAKQVFPRPTAGALRPVVRSQTVKYNMKKRAGRGFTLEELKVRTRPAGWLAGCCRGRLIRAAQLGGRL